MGDVGHVHSGGGCYDVQQEAVFECKRYEFPERVAAGAIVSCQVFTYSISDFLRWKRIKLSR